MQTIRCKTAADSAWVQVAGRIAIHEFGAAPRELEGSTRTLLGLLIAAGPCGSTVDDIAAAYWPEERGNWWQVGLRAAINTLARQLPSGWTVATDEETVRLVVPENGWVDAWRVVTEGPLDHRPEWLAPGTFFDGLRSAPLVDQARSNLETLVPADAMATELSVADFDRLQHLRRAAVLGSADQQEDLIARLIAANSGHEHHLVVGEPGLSVPFAPYLMAFPAVRETLTPDSDDDIHAMTRAAWQAISDELTAADATDTLLLIANADALDLPSRMLTARLLERSPSAALRIWLFARSNAGDIRWLDFVHRSTVGGCELVELP